MSGLEEIWDAEEGDHLNYRVNSWDETYNPRPRARDDCRPHHEIPLRARGQWGRLERLVVLVRAPLLSTSISLIILATC